MSANTSSKLEIRAANVVERLPGNRASHTIATAAPTISSAQRRNQTRSPFVGTHEAYAQSSWSPRVPLSKQVPAMNQPVFVQRGQEIRYALSLGGLMTISHHRQPSHPTLVYKLSCSLLFQRGFCFLWWMTFYLHERIIPK
jgi:hypothetical protein